MASGEVVLGGFLTLVEVDADDQDDEKIAEDDDVIRKSEMESRHRRLPNRLELSSDWSFDSIKQLLTLTNWRMAI
jgi:hypothetical protein